MIFVSRIGCCICYWNCTIYPFFFPIWIIIIILPSANPISFPSISSKYSLITCKPDSILNGFFTVWYHNRITFIKWLPFRFYSFICFFIFWNWYYPLLQFKYWLIILCQICIIIRYTKEIFACFSKLCADFSICRYVINLICCFR